LLLKRVDGHPVATAISFEHKAYTRDIIHHRRTSSSKNLIVSIGRSRCIFLGAAVLAACVAMDAHAKADDPQARPSLVHVSARTRALVIAPHPDDAVLGAGGLVRRIVRLGGSVQIVEMTSGDAFAKGVAAVRPATRPSPGTYRWYGSLREKEVRQAMRALGVGRSRIRLLGFPDDGLCDLAGQPLPGVVFASPYTRRDSPPIPEQLLPGAKYRGEDLRREIHDLLLAFRPTLVVIPDPRDDHPDHCATHLFVHDALDQAVAGGLRRPELLHFLIHAPGWPEDDRLRRSPAGGWQVLHLTPGERDGKRRAIEAYRSQVAVMASFLRAFDAGDEWFGGAERDATMRPCWCGGANIASPHGPQ
jgi:LmbE family N-acetylglucosaminyl deacetylase